MAPARPKHNGERKDGQNDRSIIRLGSGHMPHFKLTHFDQVWDALSDPANTGLASAFRLHFEHMPLPDDARDAAVIRLNFLLDRCGSAPIERDRLVLRDKGWHVQLSDEHVARALQDVARDVVEKAAPHFRAIEGRPKVSPDPLVARLVREVMAAVGSKRKTGSEAPRAGGELAARVAQPAHVLQGLPYDVSASIPGDDGPGQGVQSGSPYALHATAPLDSPHYTQVRSGDARRGAYPGTRAPEPPGP
jgi:hypothetical protein